MNRIEFTFDNASHYALYEIMHLDGMEDYYLELRDRVLISEFGIAIHFKRDAHGGLHCDGGDNAREKHLLETIVMCINGAAAK